MFKGAIRVSEGHVGGLRPSWRRGYGRWVRGVLVWTSLPLLLRNELVLGGAAVARAAEPGEVERLGEAPVVVELAVDDASVFVGGAGGGLRVGARAPLARQSHDRR